jgi:hypothetical protein
MKREILELVTWTRVRPKLNANYDFNQDWQDVIELFKTRMYDKYFDPINSLIAPNRQKGEGFSIVTLQCSLIESFASLKTGQIYNHKMGKKPASFEYNKSREMFVGFLESAPIFQDNFWVSGLGGAKVSHPDFSAVEFYHDVRCGLMHEARTKNNWYINTNKAHERTSKIFLIKEKDGKIRIYRTVLHHLLVEHLGLYLAELSADNATGAILRRFFARKLDHIFDISADAVYFEWWVDP